MQRKKGISLIVLIITIIVMIILAGAIIITLNNSEIIQKANEAVEVTDLSQVKHIATLKWSEAYLDKKTSQTDLYNAVIDGLKEENINTENYDITVTEAGVDVALKVKVPTEWTENVIAIVDGVPIPKGFVASPYDGENTKNSGLVIYELNEGEESIPSDETEYTSWTKRNQYVWVPVAEADFITKFVRKNFELGYTISNRLGANYWEVVLDLTTNMPLSEQGETYITYEGTTNTLAEVQAMYASVKEYEGFYIARYEAGIDTKRTSNNGVLETNVYSMMGKIPYTYIPWAKNDAMDEDRNGAVQVARSLYPVTNTEYGVVSTLTYSVQWDTVLQWWLDTNAVTSLTNSTAYGNYTNHVITSVDDLNEDAQVANYEMGSLGSYVEKESSTLTYPKESGRSWALSTGALKTANVNNIYDMAGNMYEWTMEGCSTSTRVTRGGHFRSYGTARNEPVADRYTDDIYPDEANGFIGFRPSLYIKK